MKKLNHTIEQILIDKLVIKNRNYEFLAVNT